MSLEIFASHDVFTPTQPAKLTFINRDSINNDLVESLQTPGTQVVVYGHTGSGKTTLLSNKLSQIYPDHLTTRCMKGMSFESIVLDAFDQLAPFYEEEIKKTSLTSKTTKALGAYSTIKISLESFIQTSSQSTERRLLPPQLTPQALGKLIGQLKLCWVIEDFHKIENSEKEKLSQLLKVFMDLAYEHPTLKIICLGAVDTARQVINYDHEMRERVSEISVPLMTSDELLSIINKGEKLLNISFSTSVKKKVLSYACGIASICHRLCLSMCNHSEIISTQQEITAIPDTAFDKAVEKYIRNTSDTLKHSFEKALRKEKKTKFDSSNPIIDTLSLANDRGLDRFTILKRIQEKEPSYTDHILKTNLTRLIEDKNGAVIKYDSNSALYSFQSPFYRSYAQSIKHELCSPEEIINTMINVMQSTQENIDTEELSRLLTRP